MNSTLYSGCRTPYVLNPSRNDGAMDTMYTDYEKWQNYVLNNYHNRGQKTNAGFNTSQCDFKSEESIFMLRDALFRYINESNLGAYFEKPIIDRYGIIRIAPKNLNNSVINDIKCKL